MKKRRNRTDEFKRDAVQLLVNRGTRTVEQVAKSMGVSPAFFATTWSKSCPSEGESVMATVAPASAHSLDAEPGKGTLREPSPAGFAASARKKANK